MSEAIFCGAVVRLAHQLISGSSVLLDLTKLRLDQVEAGIFAFEFATQSLCQRMTFPGLEINLRPAQLRLDPTDPLGKQQTLDPKSGGCPVNMDIGGELGSRIAGGIRRAKGSGAVRADGP